MLLVQAIGACAAGAMTGVGPCAVPRYMALLGVISRHGESMRARVLFFVGVAAAYVIFAEAGSAVSQYAGAPQAAIVVALTFGSAGVAGLVVRSSCTHASNYARRSSGGSFFAGLLSSVSWAPCCAPVVLAFGAFLASGASFSTGTALLAAFLLGHLAPTFIIAAGISRFAQTLRAARLADAVQAVGSACMLALGIYYGVAA